MGARIQELQRFLGHQSIKTTEDSYGWLSEQSATVLARARICTHVFRNAAWLEEGALLRDAGRLAGIPGFLIQGRLDLGGPLVTAWELSQAWPGAELQVIGGAGHSTGDAGMSEAITAALDRIARGS